MRNILIFIMLALFAYFLTSCRAKSYTTDIQKDSTSVNTVLKITPSQLNSLVIDEPCDSLGNIKPFFYTFKSGKAKTIVKTIHNKIYVEQNIDSIVDSEVTKYKSTLKDKNVRVEVPYIPRWAWYSITLNSLLLIWTFKKPLLKIITGL